MPSTPPTAARTSPVAGSRQTNAPCSSGEIRLTPSRKHLLGLFLQVQIQGGSHFQPPLFDDLRSVAFDQLAPDMGQILRGLPRFDDCRRMGPQLPVSAGE